MENKIPWKKRELNHRVINAIYNRPPILFLFSKRKNKKTKKKEKGKKYPDNKFISPDRIAIDKRLEREKGAKVENNPGEKIKRILIRNINKEY